jgi:myo-inositol 2-dehydrogenase/D-chiro-inositol 1-dehydrogenase
MRFALIGAGRIGIGHARALAGTPGVDDLLIADAVPERAATAAAEVGARAVASIDAALAEAEAVVIAAATTAHAELIAAAVDRGLPTFCEKPLAADLEATLATAARIDATGVPFQLGFQRRFDKGYLEAKRRIDSGELGTMYAFRLTGHDPAPPHES